MLAIYISAAQSGGHLNPAVSLAFALVRQDDFPLQSVLPYWIAQLAGAFMAGAMNLFLFTTAISNYEAELLKVPKDNEDFLESGLAFGNYWR
jgi:glycerol uptake facilitator protein